MAGLATCSVHISILSILVFLFYFLTHIQANASTYTTTSDRQLMVALNAVDVGMKGIVDGIVCDDSTGAEDGALDRSALLGAVLDGKLDMTGAPVGG